MEEMKSLYDEWMKVTKGKKRKKNNKVSRKKKEVCMEEQWLQEMSEGVFFLVYVVFVVDLKWI